MALVAVVEVRLAVALVAVVEVRLAVALAAVAEVCPALAVRPAVEAVALEEERNNDVESTRPA